jgi:hypothetical protein
MFSTLVNESSLNQNMPNVSIVHFSSKTFNKKEHTIYHFPKFVIDNLVEVTLYCHNVENLNITFMDLSVKNTEKI